MKLEDPTETWDFFMKGAGESYVSHVESGRRLILPPNHPLHLYDNQQWVVPFYRPLGCKLIQSFLDQRFAA